MFYDDYIMRQIEGLTRFLAKAVLHKTETEELLDENFTVSEEGLLSRTLLDMLSQGRVNEAENLLHETIEAQPRPEYLKIALRFYRELAGMDDERLGRCNFSREEIAEGLADVRRLYGAEEEST